MLIENITTEFKREYCDNIKNTVAAFANTNGGTLYIGVNDDGTVNGVEDRDGVMLKATNMIRDAIRPDVTMFTECSAEILEGKNVLVVTVQRGTARPYYLTGKGIRPEGVYLRQGASTVPATEAAILKMIKETSGEHYEDACSVEQNLTFKAASAYFAKKNLSLGKSQMRTLRFIGEDGRYTNVAFLLSDQNTHSIKAAVFEGTEKTVFTDRLELSGSLTSQAEAAYEYIDRYNRTRSELSGLDRADVRDYPPEAVREALLNMVVHRDYSFSAPSLISVFDNRIEFVSIGGLVRGITPEDVMLGISVPRSPHLAEIFYRLKLIEAYGTGIPKINECYREKAVKPKFEISDNVFKVTLPNANHSEKATSASIQSRLASPRRKAADEHRADAMKLFDTKDSMTRMEIQKALGISQPSAITLIRMLIENGDLEKTGRGKLSRYRLETKQRGKS